MPKQSDMAKAIKVLTEEEKRIINDNVRKWIPTHKVKEDIMSIPLDRQAWKAFNKMDKRTQQRYIKSVHEQFNIQYYKNKTIFMKSIESQGYGNVISAVQAEVLWERYKYREQLIMTGQYEKFRYENFRENYIKAMIGKGHSKELVDKIKDLSFEELKAVANISESDKNKIANTKLPALGGYNYKTQGTMDLQGLAEEAEDIEKAIFIATGKETSLSFVKKHTKKEDRLRTKLGKEIAIEDYGSVYLYYEDKVRERYKDKINKRVDKYGNVYHTIVGIGSERGKRADVVARIVEIVNKK